MDYYHQIFCRFRKCKQKDLPPLLLSNDFRKSCIFFFKKFSNDFFLLINFFDDIKTARVSQKRTFVLLTFLNPRWHFWNKIV